MLLLIDNYDSFTYNLMQYFAALGQQVMVRRNDDINIAQITALAPDYLVISPGPKSPDDAGISLKAIEQFAGKLPILGVCLGHQAIAQVFGAQVVRARQVMHGKNSMLEHQQQSVFATLPSPLSVTRYHSLVVAADTLPAQVIRTAYTAPETDGWRDLMGLWLPELQLHGVQFHPEAILTEHGRTMLANFLAVTA